MTLLADVLSGEQTPTYSSLPPSLSSAGQEAVELAASAGLVLDDSQALVLAGALGERRDGRWAAFEVAVVEPRQNGKGAIVEARELAGLFLFGERLILHSAHEFKTASEAFIRVLALIESTPDLMRKVRKVWRSHGDEGIELKSGQRLRFIARSTGSGRGFSGDLVVLDESFNLMPANVAALLPTMSARPNPQLWYTSSAPLPSSLVLKKLCRRGRAGTSAGLAFFEWCARIDPGLKPQERTAAIQAALDDRGSWAQANPALGLRISEEFIEREREAMDDEEFARERLGIYPDEAVETLIPTAIWDLVCSPDAQPDADLTFGVDINLDRSAAAIVAAGTGKDPDGNLVPVAEVIEHRGGLGWLVDRAVELNERWKRPTWVVDGRSTAPVASFVPKLRDAGLTVVEVPGGDVPAACGDFLDAVVDAKVRVRRHASLDAAVEGLDRRFSGDAWVWDRRAPSTDISPLYAATVALWAHQPNYDVLDSVR